MPESKLKRLLKEKEERENFERTVIAAINLQYNKTNIDEVVCKDSATAGHVYSYLSTALKIKNSTKFQAKIKSILIENNIIKPVYSSGIIWFKGLGALKEDFQKAHICLQQHYNARATYRAKQSANANKRYFLGPIDVPLNNPSKK